MSAEASKSSTSKSSASKCMTWVFGGLPPPVKLAVVPAGQGHMARCVAQYVERHGWAGLRRETNESGVYTKGLLPNSTSKASLASSDALDNVGPTRAISEDELPRHNHYQLLGLDSFGVGVDDDMIRRAYHRALLVYHPDKLSGSSKTEDALSSRRKNNNAATRRDGGGSGGFDDNDNKRGGSDAVFLAVQKAFEILSNEQTRRAYDSTNQFDDEIPSGKEAQELGDAFDFYATYGPVFRSNARFATRKPVPDLGDDASNEAHVDAFYEYWWGFESWRDFGLEAREHDPEQAEDRYEKRWMAKENEKLAKKRKKEEYARIVTLIDRARANDPRLKRWADAKLEAKLRAKRLKADADAAARAASDAMELLTRLEAAKAEKVKADESKERKAARDRLKKAKRRAEKALFARVAKARDDRVDGALLDDEFQALVATLDPDELVALSERADSMMPEDDGANNSPAAVQAFLKKCLADKRAAPDTKLAIVAQGRDVQKNRGSPRESSSSSSSRPSGGLEPAVKPPGTTTTTAGETAAAASTTPTTTPTTQNNAKAPWSDEEASALAKAIKKFPAGARQRWEGIADYVSTQLRLAVPRTKDECIAKSRELARGAAEPAKHRIRQQPGGDKAATTTTDGGRVANPNKTSSPSENDDTKDDWTEEQQRQLERGLANHPASLDANERWKRISNEVQGKSKRECVERFKLIREKLKVAKA